MLNLVFSCLKFLQLRGSPAELPYRPHWLPILIAADVLVGILLTRLLGQTQAPLLELLADGLHLLLLAGVLWLRSRSVRFIQTAIATLGVGLLLSLLLLPPILIMVISCVDFAAGGTDSVTAHAAMNFLSMIQLTLLVWFLLAEGQLLRHTLELPFAASTVIALAMLLVQFTVITRLLPAP